MDMTYKEWIEKYKPIMDANGSPIKFDTYKVENPLTVWIKIA